MVDSDDVKSDREEIEYLVPMSDEEKRERNEEQKELHDQRMELEKQLHAINKKRELAGIEIEGKRDVERNESNLQKWIGEVERILEQLKRVEDSQAELRNRWFDYPYKMISDGTTGKSTEVNVLAELVDSNDVKASKTKAEKLVPLTEEEIAVNRRRLKEVS